MRLKVLTMLLAAALIAAAAPLGAAADGYEKLEDYIANKKDFSEFEFDNDLSGLPYYNEYRRDLPGAPPLSPPVKLLPGAAVQADGKPAPTETRKDGAKLLTAQKGADYTWTFELEKDAEAVVYAMYLPAEGNSGIVRSVLINGALPFIESRSVAFDRRYADSGGKKRAANGDDIRPRTGELFEWSAAGFTDAAGLYAEPFVYRFKKGVNTLTLGYISGEMQLEYLCVQAPAVLDDYKGYLSRQPRGGAAESLPVIQAEDGAVRNDPAVRQNCDADAGTVPLSEGDFRLNILGDERWSAGNQWAQWAFTVKRAGYYTISFRANQCYNDGRSSYRQVWIDGAVLFRELLAYEIPYGGSWQNVTLSEGGQPFHFYFEPGEHTVRLTTKTGPMSAVSNELERAALSLSQALRSIIRVTGHNIDRNYRYELDKKAPAVISGLRGVLDGMKRIAADMEARYRDEKPSLYYSITAAVKLLAGVTANADSITTRYDELNALQGNLGQWVQDLRENALGVDCIYVLAAGEQPPKAGAGFFRNFISGAATFFKSFVKDYNNISGSAAQGNKTLKAWIAMGREWSEPLRDLSANEFTRQHGVNVQLNTFPSGQLNAGSTNALMLAVNAGTQPDVCIGISSPSVGEFAMRDVAADLTALDGFEDFTGLFIDNAFVPFKYREGVFGVPCTQDFTVLFYRKDILSNLGLGVPETWDGVRSMIAALSTGGYQFYYPLNPAPFIFQHQASYYSDDLRSSAADSPAFYEAFSEYTELFRNYRIPMQANFINRFRSGEMPVGVGSYETYVTLITAAPELIGRWGVHPLPGTRKPDGTIDRSASASSGTANMILKGSAYVNEAWTFLKWWMGEEVQVAYGRQVESVIGAGARWNSANLRAFKRLPWSDEEIEVISAQWKFNKDIPVVPGSFATARYMGFAWTNVVVGNAELRGALEEAAEAINKQMDKKYKEFDRKR